MGADGSEVHVHDPGLLAIHLDARSDDVRLQPFQPQAQALSLRGSTPGLRLEPPQGQDQPFEGHPVVPVRFLRYLLPDPASLAPGYTGKTCRVNRNAYTRSYEDGNREIKPFPAQFVQSIDAASARKRASKWSTLD